MYAVYQDGYTIYGTGNTLAEAITDANQWLDEPVSQSDLADPDHHNNGDLTYGECTMRLADHVQKHGGDVVWTTTDNGELDLDE